jgi:hypothetical protein
MLWFFFSHTIPVLAKGKSARLLSRVKTQDMLDGSSSADDDSGESSQSSSESGIDQFEKSPSRTVRRVTDI